MYIDINLNFIQTYSFFLDLTDIEVFRKKISKFSRHQIKCYFYTRENYKYILKKYYHMLIWDKRKSIQFSRRLIRKDSGHKLDANPKNLLTKSNIFKSVLFNRCNKRIWHLPYSIVSLFRKLTRFEGQHVFESSSRALSSYVMQH